MEPTSNDDSFLASHDIAVDCPAGSSAETVELTMSDEEIEDASTLTGVSVSKRSDGIDLWVDQQWPAAEEGGETRLLASGNVSGPELERGFVDCGIYGEPAEYSCRIFSLPDYAVVDTEFINTSDPAHIAVPTGSSTSRARVCVRRACSKTL